MRKIKKPKVWDIAVLTVIAAVMIAAVFMMGLENTGLIVCVLVILYLTGVLLMLAVALKKQLVYNIYSYNTIYYIGFSLFVISVILLFIILTWRMARDPETYNSRMILHLLLGSARNYMLISAPFIFMFSVILSISNISLIIHEGRRFVNLLGIILSFMMIGGEIFLFRFNFYATGSMMQVMIHDMIVQLYAAIYLYCECMLIGAIIASLIAIKRQPHTDKDFVIILGCGIRKDGTPTPILKGRIDMAIEFASKQEAETGKKPIFIASGGQGEDEVISEAECIKRYLISQGIPENRIITEDQSRNTFENMKFSKAKIIDIIPDAKVGFSTTNYHVFRSGLFAKRVKMDAEGMGARTKWYFWPNAWVREFVGLMTEHRLKQAVVLGSMIIIYVLLTVISYQL